MKLKILLIDDNEQIRSDYTKLLTGEKIGDYKIAKVESGDFREGIERLREQHFDIVVLDLCKGDPNPESEKTGEEVLKEIQKTAFVPVVFFTGLPGYVEGLVSEIIKVCSKGDAFDGLKIEIESILKTDYLKLKSQIVKVTNESIRSFFWDFVHPKKDLIGAIKDEVSLTYLLLRRLSNMLSKEQIRNFLEDDKLKAELAHSMEFYIYPPLEGEFEMGDILQDKESEEVFVLLTPSCDLVKRRGKPRKAEMILLAKSFLFKEHEDVLKFTALLQNKNRSEGEERQFQNLNLKIKEWMRNNQGVKDRYFFLPGTPFIESGIVDFQHKLLVDYAKLQSNFIIVARLDDPFAQSLLSTFIRYYNRVGFPDLDVDYAFDDFFKIQEK